MIKNEVCVFVANDNMLKAMVTILMEETLVDNFLLLRFKFIRNNCVKSREIKDFILLMG